MRFIHTADLHLGLTLKTASFKHAKAHTERVFEITESLFCLFDVVKKQQIPMVFIAGDFFDHDQLSLSLVETFFDRIKQLPANVFIVFGNHDQFLKNPVYQPMMQSENIHLFSANNHKISMPTVDVYGYNTTDFNSAHLSNLSLDKSKKNVLILHGDVTNKNDDHYLTDIQTLKQYPFNYIALGHQHKHEFLAPHIAYSGNLEPFDFSETGAKGYIDGDLSTNTFTFKAFNQRSFYRHIVQVHHTQTMIDIKQNISNQMRKDSVKKDFHRIELTGTYDISDPFNTESLKTLLEDDFYYLEIINKLKPGYDLNQLKTLYKDTIIETVIDLSKDTDALEDSVLLAISALLETAVKS